MLNVEIISPKGVILGGAHHMVVVPSIDGDIGVMYGHESFVAQLREGKVTVYNGAQAIEKEVEISGGFAQIHDGKKLVVLVD